MKKLLIIISLLINLIIGINLTATAENKYDSSATYTYFIIIETGDKHGAATKATIDVVIYGQEGNTEKITLQAPANKKPFQRKSIDTFLVSTNNAIGFIDSITIENNNKGFAPAWLLNKIQIKDTLSGQAWNFYYFKWLKKQKGKEKTTCTILAHEAAEIATWLKKPIYAIAHMSNSKKRVQQAIKIGANAIECDIKIENPSAAPGTPFRFNVNHGFHPIFLKEGLISTPLKKYLEDIKTSLPLLTLVLFDCKDAKGIDYERYGKELSLQLKQYIDPHYCVLSVPYPEMYKFFEGMKEADFNAGRDISMYDIFPCGNSPADWLNIAEKYNCNWLGMGINAYTPFSSLQDWIPPLQFSVNKKYDKGIVKKIYYWTLNKKNSIRKVLNTGVDGIVLNVPSYPWTCWKGLKDLLEVINEEPYHSHYRLADKSDSINDTYKILQPLVYNMSNPSDIYLIQGGQRHLIPDKKTLSSLQFSMKPIAIKESEMEFIKPAKPLIPLSSSLIRVQETNKIYLIKEGRRIYIPSKNMLKQLGYKFSDIIEITEKNANRIWLGNICK